MLYTGRYRFYVYIIGLKKLVSGKIRIKFRYLGVLV